MTSEERHRHNLDTLLSEGPGSLAAEQSTAQVTDRLAMRYIGAPEYVLLKITGNELVDPSGPPAEVEVDGERVMRPTVVDPDYHVLAAIYILAAPVEEVVGVAWDTAKFRLAVLRWSHGMSMVDIAAGAARLKLLLQRVEAAQFEVDGKKGAAPPNP